MKNLTNASNFVDISYYWRDDKDKVINHGTIKLSNGYEDDEDDTIFYYCQNISELESLMNEDTTEDFIITAYTY